MQLSGIIMDIASKMGLIKEYLEGIYHQCLDLPR